MSDAPKLKPCPCCDGEPRTGLKPFTKRVFCDCGLQALSAEIWNTRAAPIDRLDQIEIYRLIKRAGVRKHGEIAKVIADHLSALTQETET